LYIPLSLELLVVLDLRIYLYIFACQARYKNKRFLLEHCQKNSLVEL